MGLIYVDSCLVIYAVENHPDKAATLRALMSTLPADSLAVSPLVTLECLIKPLRLGDHALERRYQAALREFVQLPLPEPVFVSAARLRSRFNLKTPDAIHLACAQLHDCEQLWTNDNRLAQSAHGLAVNVFA